ncbi:MAG: PAS domain S-box protein, partial [Thermomicrobiaceae bacterium]
MTVASAESRQSVSPHNGGPWTSDWGNVLFAVIVGYVAVYIPWLIFQWGSERTYTFVSELGFLPVMVAGIIFAVRTAFSASPDGRTRGAWIAIALSFLLWLIGDAIWGMAEITQTELPYPSWADFAYFGMYVLLITGILLFPAQRLSRLDRFKFWIDSGIILIGLTVLVGYYLIGPDLLQYAEGASEAATLLAYPSLDILALIAIFSILVRNPNTGSGGVMLLLAAGLLFVVFTDLWWTALAARDQYVSGGLTYAVTYAAWSVGQTLLVTAPQRSYDIFNRSLKPASITTRIEPLRAVLPFAAAGIAIIAVLVATVPSFIDRLGLLVGVMALLPLLIAVRQIITLRENARFRLHQVRRESEERFRALVEYSSDLITVLDHDFICRFQSPSSMELLGMEPERFVG